ncbi:TldD/PmbA family protein [Candidatus Bathyarchaeota archaeon]|nr:TldD/PmbA family protein [Candidatus Bathyarchaeota archaeon]
MVSETDWGFLRDSVYKTVKKLENRNIVHAEAFFTSTQTTEVSIRNSEILTQNKADDSGVGFRVVAAKNKVGFACTNTLDEKTIQETGEKAFDIAKASSEEPNFALPEKDRIPKVKELFDKAVAEIVVEEAVDIAKRAITAAEDFDRRVIAKDGRVMFQTGWRGITNTLGTDIAEQETKTVIYLGGSGKQKGEVTGSCSDFIFSRAADLKPEIVGQNVAEMVIEMFNPKPVKTFEGTAVFGPEAVSNQLFEVLVNALKGENVLAGHSAWTKKLEEKVASESLTITDNALREKGFSSRSFDDEGYPSQNTVLIRNGQLESFLHNATTANALKMKNTGNASRSPNGFNMVRWIIGNGYRAKPEVHPSNLIIHQEKKTKDKLVSEIENGILIESMAGFPQASSGMISAHLSRAFFIKNGEKQHAMKDGMISGMAFDWFKKISGVGNDSKQFQNAVVPSVRVEGVKILGA